MLYISLLLALLAVACLIFVPNTVILLSFVAIMHGFAVYSACHALLHKRDSRAALGWIAINTKSKLPQQTSTPKKHA